jgi:hypothetical protein
MSPALNFPTPISAPLSALPFTVPGTTDMVGRWARLEPGKDLTSIDAFSIIRRQLEFGHEAYSAKGQDAFRVLSERFFPGFGDFKRATHPVNPVLVQSPDNQLDASIVGKADGDTIKLYVPALGGNMSVRLDGVDTPESVWSSKLKKMYVHIPKYLQAIHGLPDAYIKPLEDVVKARIQYLGEMASVVAGAFINWSEFVRLGPAYAHVASAAHMCDTFDYADKYGRLIGRFFAGNIGEMEDQFLKGFISTELPHVMASSKGDELLRNYEQRLAPHKAFLQQLEESHPAVYDMVSYKSLPRPREVFSKPEGRRFAKYWEMFINDDRYGGKNDFQTLLAFLGFAYPYPKYRGLYTDLDISAEQFALGQILGVHKQAGLTIDPIYMFMRPSVQGEFASPVFQMFPDEMTGGKDLHPESCCTKFGCPIG